MKKTLKFFGNLGFDIACFFMDILEEIGEMFLVLGYWFSLLVRALLTIGIPLATLFGIFVGILWIIKLFV